MTEQTTLSINDELLDDLLNEARISPRLRAIRRLHSGDWEHCHRMLNALLPGTYIQPHRHPDRHQGEGFILLRGELALVIFDDQGIIDPDRSLILSTRKGSFGMDIRPNTWHCLIALEETVIYEVKGQPAGGYVQSNDKIFAPWAPAEGDPAARAYLPILVDWVKKRMMNDE